MITIRFPSGFSVQYNDATTVEPLSNGGHDIIRKEPRKWFARVPADCLIEGSSPCKTYQAADTEPWKVVADLRREVESLKRKLKRNGQL